MSTFDEAAYRPFAAPGSATVTGNVFLVVRCGSIEKGASLEVFLIPETPFVTARINDKDPWHLTFESLGSSGTDQDTIARAWRYTRIAVADFEGKFAFTKVPAGNYLVETRFSWQYTECGPGGCFVVEVGVPALRQRAVFLHGSGVILPGQRVIAFFEAGDGSVAAQDCGER